MNDYRKETHQSSEKGFISSLIPLIIILTGVFIFCTFFVFNRPVHAGSVTIEDTNGVPQGLHIWPHGFLGMIPSDQVTRPVDLTFAQISGLGVLSLAEVPTQDSYTIVMSAGHSFISGDLLSIVSFNNPEQHNYYSGKVLNVATNTLTMDTPIPYPFALTGTIVYERSSSMNVDGSSTTQVFSLGNPYSDSVDVTRLIVHILDDDVMDDGTFGGISALTRGIVFRKKAIDGEGYRYVNYWNVKTNGDFGLLAYDRAYADKPPAGTGYGFTARLTYAGSDKHGVAIRVESGEEIEILIQDDLTDLTDFRIVVQGHHTTIEQE